MDNKTTHPQTMAERFADVLRIQKAEAERDLTDTYMVGLYNGMLMMCCNADNTDDYRPIKAQMKETVPAPQREWVGLTENDIYECFEAAARSFRSHKSTAGGQQISPADDPDSHLVWVVERLLKEKNHG